MTETPDILKRILVRKREEVFQRSRDLPLARLEAQATQASPPRGFAAHLMRRAAAGRPAVIAEIKRASPSKGRLRDDFRPPDIAKSYEMHGATCLSVLTDRDFFQGQESDLIGAREACLLPVIRKDFMVDPYQVFEARAIGADCILLIVACLSDDGLKTLGDLATDLEMDVLVEVHDAEELERALLLPHPLIGINNRDLRSFEVKLETTISLLPSIPSGRLVVTESGIHSATDVALMHANGVNAFLVGESLMRAPDPGAQLATLFGPADPE